MRLPPGGTAIGPLTAIPHAQLSSSAPYGEIWVEREVAGLLLGFPPTVHGNFLSAMRNWIESRTPLELQQHLAERIQAGDTPLAAALAALLRPMLDTMQGEPVPPMLWRRPAVKGWPTRKRSRSCWAWPRPSRAWTPAAEHQERRDALMFGRRLLRHGVGPLGPACLPRLRDGPRRAARRFPPGCSTPARCGHRIAGAADAHPRANPPAP